MPPLRRRSTDPSKRGNWQVIVELSKDVFTIPEEEILNTDVVYTILGGKIIYSSEAEKKVWRKK